MCLFVEAAKAWQQLTKTRYYIAAGRKGKLYRFRLEFGYADFPHLAGMQYAQDVDFGLRASEYYGEKLIPALLNNKMDGAKIEKSRSWEKIRGRLHAIINLQQTLESDFSIALFDPAKSNSKIVCGEWLYTLYRRHNRRIKKAYGRRRHRQSCVFADSHKAITADGYKRYFRKAEFLRIDMLWQCPPRCPGCTH